MLCYGPQVSELGGPECMGGPVLPPPGPCSAAYAVNARRSSLAPSSVDKVIFVHENALINE